jgi:hypothetical protein
MELDRIEKCQIKENGDWVTIDIFEAFRRGEIPMRCPTCHGAVKPHMRYLAGSYPYFLHLRVHAGCPTRRRSFSGIPSMHPDALT